MTQTYFFPTIITAGLATILVSCGPETNSRYGDQYWDPNETKAKFDPIEVPDYTVTYKEVTPAPNLDYDAYVAIDFTDLDRQSKDGVVIYYTRGISGEKDIEDLLQTPQSSFTDSSFLNDLENAIDYRLTAAQPGDYKIVLDFDVIWPNGNTVSYLMDDITFTVPGCQQSHDFYSDYINPVIAENCVSCHSAVTDARTAMDLSGTVNVRRDVFLEKTNSTALPTSSAGSMTMLEYVFDEDHPGYATALGITGNELTAFRAYITALKSISEDATDARVYDDNFTFEETDTGYDFCLPQPTTFVVEES